MSPRTYQNAKAVVDAARAEPEKFVDILETMDKTGRVNGAYKQLKVRKQSAEIAAEAKPAAE